VVYRFDDFVLDTATRRLLRAGAEARLSPKAFDLLQVLVANRARAVSKAELMEHLWPSTHVLESNLASLIAEIRRALDDSSESPRYIRTMQRFGYWFIGPLDAAGPGPSRRCWLMLDTQRVALEEGDAVLGRAPDATVWIDVPGVSRYHARIRVEGQRATVEDLASKNGTYLRGRRVSAPSALSDGDEIRLGSCVVVFRVPPPADTTTTLARGRSRGGMGSAV
jgi:DNA-binding winged helix-turn-helix (wHTH) protein